jgi:hypothetical protein
MFAVTRCRRSGSTLHAGDVIAPHDIAQLLDDVEGWRGRLEAWDASGLSSM